MKEKFPFFSKTVIKARKSASDDLLIRELLDGAISECSQASEQCCAVQVDFR